MEGELTDQKLSTTSGSTVQVPTWALQMKKLAADE
jgi:hypothetical protein